MARTKRNIKPKPARCTRAKKSTGTTRSRGGAGFDFEDQVAAWLTVKMLRAELIPGIDVTGQQLQMQTHALGWEVDDVLVEGATSSGEPGRLAISCKGNVQVTASGLPKDFVLAVWRQWRKTDPTHRERDSIALVTRGRNTAFDATWSDIKGWCADGNAASALANINASEKHKKVFRSVKRPLTAGTDIPSDEDAVALIRRIEVVPLDLQLTPSHTERDAIAHCRDLLRTGTTQTAKDLWGKLIKEATQARLQGGTIRLADLWAALRRDFDLEDHPDFSSSWRSLNAVTAEYKSTVQTTLPTGFHTERARDIDAIVRLLGHDAVSVIYGNSGCGKSALVKSTLDGKFPDWQQVWLGPEQLDAALNAVKRATVGLSNPLQDILVISSRQKNVLVIDAAERLTDECAAKAKRLVQRIAEQHAQNASWHILIVGQTEAWADGRLPALAGGPQLPERYEVQELFAAEVRDALRSVPALHWLALHDDAVAVLANLRTLGWVIGAESRFRSNALGDVISLPAVADRLWRHWTNGQAKLQTLLMRLADRDAKFERSFALSQLQMDEAAAFDSRPQQCPLRLNARNRIEFEHDLATDWSRYQQLKEIAPEVAKWAALASNPLWHGALRMLGQSLLREPAGAQTAWDVAFEAVENSKEAPLAPDILLDALCLDPLADTFLNERADMLFQNHGARLRRLLGRFHHIATISGVPRELVKPDDPLRLHLEAHYRTPILGRWLCMARFFARQQKRLAELMSPVVAKTCETWLSTTPKEVTPGVATPFRKEFAEIALATARAVQVAQGQRVIFIDDAERPIYSAAFAAATDLPDDVAQWALEMAKRRALSTGVAQKIYMYHRKQAEERAEKLRTDPEYRKRDKERRSFPTTIPSGRPLPPWPLGPRGRVENDFSHSCLHSTALGPLMRFRPQAAAEVLLATIIEDSPEESYSSSSRFDAELGLAFDHEGYPTAFWKSPFFQFLQIDSTTALDTLLQLVEFCTDRWTKELRAPSRAPRLSFTLQGRRKVFVGNGYVFDWPQENSMHNGQLHSALSALERWLCMSIDEGRDITPVLNNLLTESNSAGILGVVVNVGKYKPALFAGPLLPLLANPALYHWDDYRTEMIPHRFDMYAWVRAGETIFEMAKQWIFAAYRRCPLRELAGQLANTNPVIGEYLERAIQEWKYPTDKKEALELRILAAQLDRRNYVPVRDAISDNETYQLGYPEALKKDIATYQAAVLPKLHALTLPSQCDRILQLPRMLTPDEAAKVAATLSSISAEEDEETQSLARVAVAAALAVKAPDWLQSNATVLSEVTTIIDELIGSIGETAEDLRIASIGFNRGELKFAAYAVVSRWISTPDKKLESQLLRLITSRDAAASGIIMQLAHLHRAQLGVRWWRLLYVGLLWSALAVLAPRYHDEPDVGQRWLRWLRWLRSRELAGVNCSKSDIDPLAVAQRVGKIEEGRRRRRERGQRVRRPSRGKRHYSGLDTHELERVFSWLLKEGGSTGTEQDREFVALLWKFEVWRRYAELEDDENYPPPSNLGYAILQKTASLLHLAPVEQGPDIWKPILSLGPDAHYSIGHFITCWFLDATHQSETRRLAHHWRAMIEYALSAPNWMDARRWYYGESLLRQLVGFGADKQIAALPQFEAIVIGMRDLYERWARKHLNRDEDNIAAFCTYLASEAGAPIRLDGLIWVADTVTSTINPVYLRRDRSGNAMVELLDVIITRNGQEFRQKREAREALIRMAAILVSQQVPAALLVQERISRLG